MRAAHCVGSHLLQYAQLAVESVLVDGGTKATEVMVLAHSVNLHRIAIKRKALCGIKLKRAESRSCLVSVNHLAVLLYRGYHLIYIRVLARP